MPNPEPILSGMKYTQSQQRTLGFMSWRMLPTASAALTASPHRTLPMDTALLREVGV